MLKINAEDKYAWAAVTSDCSIVQVTKTKKWKEICGLVNIGTSASAAFTLKKNYIKYLFTYECQFDRGGTDPAPILAQMEAQLQQKREQKHRRAPSPGMGFTRVNEFCEICGIRVDF